MIGGETTEALLYRKDHRRQWAAQQKPYSLLLLFLSRRDITRSYATAHRSHITNHTLYVVYAWYNGKKTSAAKNFRDCAELTAFSFFIFFLVSVIVISFLFAFSGLSF